MRYPLEPLLAMMRCTLSQAQKELGIGGPEYRKYRAEGMTREVAERKADKAGFHVYEVWPEMVTEDAGKQACAAPDCPVVFVPPTPKPGQKRRHYCSRTCQQRTNARMRYRSNEATRERRKAQARQYKQEIRELAQRRKAG